jgi:hypothetical protein
MVEAMAGVGACCVGAPVTRLEHLDGFCESWLPDAASSSNREGKASWEKGLRTLVSNLQMVSRVRDIGALLRPFACRKLLTL